VCTWWGSASSNWRKNPEWRHPPAASWETHVIHRKYSAYPFLPYSSPPVIHLFWSNQTEFPSEFSIENRRTTSGPVPKASKSANVYGYVAMAATKPVYEPNHTCFKRAIPLQLTMKITQLPKPLQPNRSSAFQFGITHFQKHLIPNTENDATS
jgi:hypothetical protein